MSALRNTSRPDPVQYFMELLLRRGSCDLTNKGELEGTSAVEHRCKGAEILYILLSKSMQRMRIQKKLAKRRAKQDSKCDFKLFPT